MAIHVKWNGKQIREFGEFRFKQGEIHVIEDEQLALDMLTQPGEPFEDVTPTQTLEQKMQSKPKRTRKKKAQNSTVGSK